MDWDSLMDRQTAQSQTEGQEDRGEVKELGGVPLLIVLGSPGSPGLPSGSWLPGNPASYLKMAPKLIKKMKK